MAKIDTEGLRTVGELALERFSAELPATIYRVMHRHKDGLRRTHYYDTPGKAIEALDYCDQQGHELIGVWEYEMSDLPLSRHPQ